MSIATAITAAQGRVADAYTAISNKGGTLPATQNLTNMPTAINSISSADIVTAINNSSSTVTSGDKVWLSEVGISGQSTSAINQHWAMSTSGNYVPTVASYKIYPSLVNSPTSYTTGSTSVVDYDVRTSPSYIPNYIYGDSGCYSAQYNHVFACDDNGVYGHTLDSANSTVFKTFVVGSNIVWTYNSSVSSYAFHRMNRNGITLIPNSTSANNTNNNYFYTNGYLYKEPTKNSFYDRYDGSYRTYNLETGELGSETTFSINSLSDWWYPHVSAIFGVTSDGKYIIGASRNPIQSSSMKLQFGKINSLGNLSKVSTAPSALSDFYDGTGTAKSLACSFNPNNDLLILTEFNTANYWMFKYNPSDESWSNVTADLSSGFDFTGKYFQGPMCASNDMKNFSFIYSTQNSSSMGRNVYQAYVRMGSYAIKDFYGTEQNFTTYGSPTITSNGISGFSSSNYLKLSEEFNPSNNSWELNTKLYITSPSTNQFFMGSSQSNYGFVVGSINGILTLFLSSDGTNWDIASAEQTYNTSCPSYPFYLRLSFSGNDYKLEISQDKTNWTTAVLVSSSSAINASDIYLGNCYDFGTNYCHGSIDLSETYITVNGKLLWSPYTNIAQDSLTGVAQENIAVGASGSVKTALQSQQENNNEQSSGGSDVGPTPGDYSGTEEEW